MYLYVPKQYQLNNQQAWCVNRSADAWGVSPLQLSTVQYEFFASRETGEQGTATNSYFKRVAVPADLMAPTRRQSRWTTRSSVVLYIALCAGRYHALSRTRHNRIVEMRLAVNLPSFDLLLTRTNMKRRFLLEVFLEGCI
jgi:hypothetical protein